VTAIITVADSYSHRATFPRNTSRVRYVSEMKVAVVSVQPIRQFGRGLCKRGYFGSNCEVDITQAAAIVVENGYLSESENWISPWAYVCE
jgi:hypothetical protein